MDRFRLFVPLALLVSACGGALDGSPSVVDPGTPSASPIATPTGTPAAPSATPSPTEAPLAAAWERLDTSGPAPREDHTWTLAGSSGLAYLFGGRDGDAVLDDTWAFDLATGDWTELTPPESPAARFGHEAAWVEGVGVVVFAGQGGPTTFFNDLWTFDPASTTWRPLPASGALPTPRYGSCLAPGPDGRLWMSHGFTQEGSRFSDTRAYDFETGAWTDLTPAQGPRPVERCLHGCWWTDDGILTLYAGQTTGLTALDDLWRLDSGAWTRVESPLPPGRNLYARDRLGDGTLVFGGQAVDGTYLADLWLITDDGPPVQLVPDGEPPDGRAGAELVVDEVTGRAFLFGGRTATESLGDTWALTGL